MPSPAEAIFAEYDAALQECVALDMTNALTGRTVDERVALEIRSAKAQARLKRALEAKAAYVREIMEASDVVA